MSGQVATAGMWKAARELERVEGPLVQIVAEGVDVAARYEGRRPDRSNRAGALAAIAELAIVGGSPQLIDALRWWYIGYHRERTWRTVIAKVGPVGGPFQLVSLSDCFGEAER